MKQKTIDELHETFEAMKKLDGNIIYTNDGISPEEKIDLIFAITAKQIKEIIKIGKQEILSGDSTYIWDYFISLCNWFKLGEHFEHEFISDIFDERMGKEIQKIL